MVSYAVLLLITVIAWIVIDRIWRFWSWLRRFLKYKEIIERIPGPPRHWLMGNLHQHPGTTDEGMDWLVAQARKNKMLFRIWYGPLNASVHLCHPDSIHPLMTVHGYETKPMMGVFANYRLVKPLLGEGLITSSGDKWFRDRRLLTPAFHFGVLRPYVEVYNQSADKLIRKWLEASGKPVEIHKTICRCTLEVVMKCAFSYEGDVQEGKGEAEKYVLTTDIVARLIMKRLYNPLKLFDFLYYNFMPEGWELIKHGKYLMNFAEDVIRRRKETLNQNGGQHERRYRDFLDLLLAVRDEKGEGLTDTELRDQVQTFLFAGHDTTASALSFTLYELARHPECQKKAREEVMAVLKSRETTALQWEDMNKFEYVTLCIKEAMRLHTTVPEIDRLLEKEIEVDGITIPAGITVAVSMYALHHNPHVWGEDYDEYRPERLTLDNRQDLANLAMIPFSAGSRNCIGQTFALNEMRVVIAKILYRFNIHLVEGFKLERLQEIVMRPKGSMLLKLEPRF